MNKACKSGPMSYSDYYVLKHHCKFTPPYRPCVDSSRCPVPPPATVDLCQPSKEKIYDIMAKRVTSRPCNPPKPAPCQPYLCMCKSKVETDCYCRNNIR